MARSNRIVIDGGSYHVTARIAHRAHLLSDPELKDLIVHWIYGIADFSGIDVKAWCIMDNHLHLYLTTPPVPERLWTSPAGPVPDMPSGPTSAGPVPAAFSMRPAENRAPRWTPDIADRDYPITPAGDRPSEEAVVRAVADGVPVVSLPRPAVGFALSDDEMVARLCRLYAFTKTNVRTIARRWAQLRLAGADAAVEREKESYCRRMYNVSQYMKSLKQRISQYFNTTYGHEGQLWDGRFYSALVDHEEFAEKLVSSYIEFNPVRAGLVAEPKDWTWNSFSTACGDGPYAARARAAYGRMLGCGWEEARGRMEAVFAARLPEGYDVEKGGIAYEASDGRGGTEIRYLSAEQLVKTSARFLSRCGFVSRRPDFEKEVLGRLPAKFPAQRAGAIGVLGRIARVA